VRREGGRRGNCAARHRRSIDLHPQKEGRRASSRVKRKEKQCYCGSREKTDSFARANKKGRFGRSGKDEERHGGEERGAVPVTSQKEKKRKPSVSGLIYGEKRRRRLLHPRGKEGGRKDHFCSGLTKAASPFGRRGKEDPSSPRREKEKEFRASFS